MRGIAYKIGAPERFSESEKKQFLDLLIKQNKVRNPTLRKLERCHRLCTCTMNEEVVSIGAIKPATKSDFDAVHADLEAQRNDFKLELGYCYTNPQYSGKGHSTSIVKMLLENVENVIASTELRNDNPMLYILQKHGFKQYGNSWESKIHSGLLGLFFRHI